MNAILCVQGTSPTSQSDLIIDGKLLKYNHLDEQDLALGFINTLKKILVYQHRDRDGTSPSYRLSISSKTDGIRWIILQGNYKDKDEVGRLIGFKYAAKLQNSNLVQTFIDYTHMAGYTLFDEDIVFTENKIKQINKNKKKWIIITMVVTLAIVTTTIYLMQ